MNEKLYSYENPFENGQSDVFMVNISDLRNNNDLQTLVSGRAQKIKNQYLGNDLVRFEEATQIQVKKISKQKSQIKFQEREEQEENPKNSINNQNKPSQKPLSMLYPPDSNFQEFSEFSLSLEQKKRKPSIMTPSTRNQTLLTPRNINSKIYQKQNKVQRERKPQTEKHVRITSQKCIKYFSEEDIQQTQEFEERSPDSFQATQNLFTQLSKQFEYVGDFSLIRKQMVELALGRKLNVMQNTNEFVTVKQTANKDYCQCLIKACLNIEQIGGGVYQLKNCIYKRNKAKFIFVSGSEKSFLSFSRNFLIRLWQIKKLKLKNDYLVEFVVNLEKQNHQLRQLKKQYMKLYNQLSGITGYDDKFGSIASKLVPKSLVTNIKDNLKRLRSPQKHHTVKKSAFLSVEQRLTELNIKVNKKYYELLNKLKQINPQINIQYLQKKLQKQICFHELPMWKLWGFYYKNNYELFIKRKQEILSKSTIKQIFKYLQIEEQYNMFLLNSSTKSLKNESKDEDIGFDMTKQNQIKSCNAVGGSDQKLFTNKDIFDSSYYMDRKQVPYRQCISCLQNIANEIMMPQKLFNLLLQFHKHLKSQYSQLYANKPLIKLSSMDQQLPVTMFVLIMAQFHKQKTVSLNLLGKLEWITRWIEQKQKEYQYQNFQRQKEEQISILKKMIITLQAASSFITNQWQLDSQVSSQKN